METREKLRKWFDWFLENQENITKEYNGKYVVIKDYEIVESYDDEEKAYFSAKKKYGLGNFLIQKCTDGEESYSMQISTPYIYTACV